MSKQERILELEKENEALRKYVADLRTRLAKKMGAM